MGDRLQGCFDRAVGAALRELDPDDISGQLDKYLADAHAIEGQALGLLDKATDPAPPATILGGLIWRQQQLSRSRFEPDGFVVDVGPEPVTWRVKHPSTTPACRPLSGRTGC